MGRNSLHFLRSISAFFLTYFTAISLLKSSQISHQDNETDFSLLRATSGILDQALLGNVSRNITFLKVTPIKGKKPDYKDKWFKEAYSGMWWQDTQHFVSTNWELSFNLMPITASFKAFKTGRARQTRDWMDFSVEHLSIFWKHFQFYPDSADRLVYEMMEDKLINYVREARSTRIPDKSPAPDTLALLPFSGTLNNTDTVLLQASLTATLTSLWRIGIGRCVVVGHLDDEAILVDNSFKNMKSKLQERSMELVYISIADVSSQELKLMPKVAIRWLKYALQEKLSAAEIQQWLGPKPSRWQFIYFTEPDLILHTRSSAMEAFRREMETGGVLTAHRFMPLPHQRSFPGYHRLDKVIPDIGMYSHIHEISDHHGDACCDTGDYYPSNPTDPQNPQPFLPCGSLLYWWRCGFFQGRTQNYSDTATVAKLHHRVPHPLVSFKDGTGWPLIHNNQRVCFPKKLGDCD